jgi:class 3 adenylate cyclase
VLFCDLVGSTSLAAGLDPEDLRDLVRAYHSRCEEVVHKFDGSVAQYLGDGVMARFGYPVAHEDDAERAIRCGLEMIEGIRELKAKGIKLEIRVGIATGVVVVQQGKVEMADPLPMFKTGWCRSRAYQAQRPSAFH